MAKNNRNKVTPEDANKVAEKMYDDADYKASNFIDKGTAITHEQASDTYTEGTIDGKIDAVANDGSLKSDDGEEIPRKRY